jgi:hypothetical protein
MSHATKSLAAALLAASLLSPAAAQTVSQPRLYCPDGEREDDFGAFECLIDEESDLTNPLINMGLGNPVGSVLSPDGQFIYVTNLLGDTYSVLRVLSGAGQFPGGAIVSPVRAGGGSPLLVNLQGTTSDTSCVPANVAVARGKLYVTCLAPVDGSTRTEEGHIEVFQPGPFGYIDTFLRRVDVDPNPQPTGTVQPRPSTSVTGLLSASNGYIYVAYTVQDNCLFGLPTAVGSVAILDPATDTIVDRFPGNDNPCSRNTDLALNEPLGLALSADATRLYVTPRKTSSPHVAEIALSSPSSFADKTTYTRINLCSNATCTGSGDAEARDPAGLLRVGANTLYVTHNGFLGSGNPRFRISIVNLTSRSVSKRLELPPVSTPQFYGFNPTSPVLTGDGRFVLVPLFGDSGSVGNHVAVVDHAAQELAAPILIPRSAGFTGGHKAEAQPVSVVAHPQYPFAYVVNNIPDNIAVIQTRTIHLGPVPAAGLLGLAAAAAALAALGVRRMRRAGRQASGGGFPAVDGCP